MNLDVRTMYMAMAAICFIVAMALFISHAGRFRRDGTLSWTVGCVFQGAFWTFLGLRGVIWDFVSIVVANTFLVASFSFLYAAVREFRGRAYNRETLLLPPVVTFVFFWYFSVYVDNISYRIIFISLLSILQIIAIVWTLFRDTPIQERRSCRLTGFAFPVMAMVWFNRLLEGFTLPYGHLSVLEATTFRNASVIVALGGVILSSIGFVFMIRERAEETLRKAHERAKWLAQFPEENPNPVLRTSAEGSVLYRNPAAVELPGWECEVGKLLPYPILPLVRQAIAEGRETEQDIELAGTFYFVSVSPLPEGPDANVYGRDITKRKRAEEAVRKSEERYRTLFEASRDAIYITTQEGEILDANQSMLDLFGYSRAEMIGLKARETYVHSEDRLKFQQVIEREGFVRDYVIKLRKKDRTEMDCLLTAIVRRTVDGNIAGYQGIVRDITERKWMEEEREKLIHELQDALANVRTLRGLLPICSYCKKIRDDKGYWNRIESYIQDHSSAEFTHGLCPECLKKHYPDLVD